MSWKIALTVALLSALVTALVTLPVADKVTKLHGVSDFEGKRGMLIGFVLIPAGLIGGFLLGLLGTKLAGAVEWSQFWKAAGWSIGLGQLALWGIAGLSLLSIPGALKAPAEAVAVEVEVLVPLHLLIERSREPGAIRMSLYASDRDNRGVDVDSARYREEDGYLVVPARAPLYSISGTRILSFHLGETWLAFDLPLQPAPKPMDQWSEPAAMRDATTSGANSVWSEVRLRYRVVAWEAAP